MSASEMNNYLNMSDKSNTLKKVSIFLLQKRMDTKKVGHVKEDRISKLPRNLQETILTFLPIRDAVRTSVLSKNWRHCWTMIPSLIFEFEFSSEILDKLSQCDDPELRAYKLVSVVNKVLRLHNGPILKFSLRFPDDCCDAQIINDYIDQWIPLFSRKGIKQLMLEEDSLDPPKESTAHDFSSLNLTHLRLLSFRFPYTPAFDSLRNLELFNVFSHVSGSIFHCPVLEKLTLILCESLYPWHFCAPNLKCLHHIYSEIFEYTLAGFENLIEYSSMLLAYPIAETKTSNVVKVFGGVHKIKKLSISMYFLKYLAGGGPLYRLSKPLLYLKTLNVSDINFKDLSEVSCLLCLIRSAPNLHELNISADQNAKLVEAEEEERNVKSYGIEDPEVSNTDHLEIVTFSYFEGLKTELELVKFLLAHSRSLETMLIHRSKRMKSGVVLTMAEEMLQYSRASSRAQIRKLNRAVEIDEFDQELWLK